MLFSQSVFIERDRKILGVLYKITGVLVLFSCLSPRSTRPIVNIFHPNWASAARGGDFFAPCPLLSTSRETACKAPRKGFHRDALSLFFPDVRFPTSDLSYETSAYLVCWLGLSKPPFTRRRVTGPMKGSHSGLPLH